MFWLETPHDFPALLQRYKSLMERGKAKRAWQLCVKYSKQKTLDSPPWMFGMECANVDLLMAHAAFKAGAFERAFFNAKTALLISEFHDRSLEIQDSRLLKSCSASLMDAHEIADSALRQLSNADMEEAQNEWRKIRMDYEKLGQLTPRKTTLAAFSAQWIVSDLIQKWIIRRRLKKQFVRSKLFGRWRTPG